MLYFLTKAYSSHTIWEFVWGAGWTRVPYMRPLSYEQLFRAQKAPRGNYVFTDFDRMTPYEIQCAGAVADALVAADPAIKIYNHPLKALERAPLLSRLREMGINDFAITRIDLGQKPPEYPVFIRSEDDCRRPDTGLLQDEAAFDAALIEMRTKGIPTKRRIAVGYRAQVSPDGYFRKYGVMRIGGRLIPQHILRNTDWYVKRGQVERDAAIEREFVELYDNYKDHADQLEPIFAAAGIDYGRADYGFVDGRMQVFEINTNPTIPKLRYRKAANEIRYMRVGPAVLEAFSAMNSPHSSGPPVRFDLPKPVFQKFPPLDWMTRGYLSRHYLNALGTVFKKPRI